MRVMPDSNVFYSALLFPDSKPAEALDCIVHEHKMVLCHYLIDEVSRVVAAKHPKALAKTQIMFRVMQYELAPESHQSPVTISDPKDQPILNAAINANVDIIVSGDKHFAGLDIDRPKVLSPSEFLDLTDKRSRMK